MWRVDSLEKTLVLGGIGGRRRRGQQRMRWLDGITDSMDWVWANSGNWWWTGRPGVLRFMGSQRVGHNWVIELNWLNWEAVLLSFGWAVFQNPFLRNFYFALIYIIRFIFFILFCILILLICNRHLSMSTHGLPHSILICVQFSWAMLSSLTKFIIGTITLNYRNKFL